MSYAYARSEPGHPGISLHTDGQPWGSEIFGYEGSVPVLIRVLNYLEDFQKKVIHLHQKDTYQSFFQGVASFLIHFSFR